MSSADLECWHGALSRSNAHRLLTSRGLQNGMYLIRAGRGGRDPVVSLVANEEVQHFVVTTSPVHLCMKLDGGPWFVGLDELIRHYSHRSHGLPIALREPCMGDSIPQVLLAAGPDTPLHLATRNNDTNAIRAIAGEQPELLEYRDRAGRTCLHLAVLGGDLATVETLLHAGSNVRLPDTDGSSAMHIAARTGNTEAIILLHKFRSELTARAHKTGWQPLHEAAYTGNYEATKLLLEMGVPAHPRCQLGKTPAELARTRNHTRTTTLVESWSKPNTVSSRIHSSHFLHGAIDRLEATNLALQNGPGSFLVRESRRRPGEFVLTMNFGNHVFNYEIRNSDHLWFSIDEGPMFESIEQLIEYYLQAGEGLPGKLTRPIEPVDQATKGLKRLQIAQKSSQNGTNHHGYHGSPQHSPGMPPLQQNFNNNGNGSSILPPVSHRGNIMMPHTDIPARRAGPQHHEQPPPPKLVDPNEFQGAQAPHIPPESLEMMNQLGEGEFGSVMQGIWHPPGPHQPLPVAIKTLRADCLVSGEQEFVREAAVMARLQHPSIVTLYGVCRERQTGTLMLVQELLEAGSALDFILNNAKTVGLEEFRVWAAQIAAGMDYLEERKLVHRDLALRNILLAGKRRAKISDFGLSRAVGSESDYYRASQGGRWPVKWYAPESVNYGQFSSKSDVWGFGITLWEMWSWGAPPYGNLPGSEVIKWIEQGGRLVQPKHCPDKVYKIMRNCWDYEKEKRPTFRELLTTFRRNPDYFDFHLS